MLKRSLAATVFILGAPSTASAAPEHLYRSVTFERCMKTGDAANGVTYAMHDCLAAEWERQDNALNAAYKARAAALAPTRRIALRDAEREWIKHRDAACADAGEEFKGGSMEPLAIDECSIDQTILQTARIKRFR